MEALKAHAEGHAPPQTKLTFRKLPFHAQPYLMPRDTVANRAATKVLRFHSSSKLCARVLDQVSVVYCMLACQGGYSRDLQAMVVIMLDVCTGIQWGIHLRSHTCVAGLLTSLLLLSGRC